MRPNGPAWLSRRIRWHYGVIVAVAVIALTGTAFATGADDRLTGRPKAAVENVLSVPPAALARPTPAPEAAAPSPQP